MPEIPTVPDEGGYGLRIVAAFASDWGVERRAGEKVVWFALTQCG